MFLHLSVILFTGDGGSTWACTPPPGQAKQVHPPAGTPPGQVHPPAVSGQVHPPTPIAGTPPGQVHPPTAWAGTPTPYRYASYWNALLYNMHIVNWTHEHVYCLLEMEWHLVPSVSASDCSTWEIKLYCDI